MRKTLPMKEFYVDPNIDRAVSLPASAFVDSEFLELELGTIFARSWLLAPSENDSLDGLATSTDPIEKTGSRVPFNLLGKPFFLQRGQHGRLNCFPNVCTHAWHPLVESPSMGGAIICPQHGRQFDNEGRFVAQAGFEKMDGFPRESDNLRNVHVDEWGQWVFVSTGQPLAPFREFIEPVQQSIPGLELASLRRHRFDGEVREVEGNWKQHAWNYMDNFHIRFVHKGPGGLADGVDLSSYKTELFSWSALQWVFARDPQYGFDSKLLADRFRDPKDPGRRVFALWWFLFPNLALNFYPWGLSVNLWMPISGRPDRTMFYWYHYSLDDEKFGRRNEIWLDEQVDREDIEAIGEVAKGVRSGFAPRGRFIPGDEAGPHWFHRLVFESIF